MSSRHELKPQGPLLRHVYLRHWVVGRVICDVGKKCVVACDRRYVLDINGVESGCKKSAHTSPLQHLSSISPSPLHRREHDHRHCARESNSASWHSPSGRCLLRRDARNASCARTSTAKGHASMVSERRFSICHQHHSKMKD